MKIKGTLKNKIMKSKGVLKNKITSTDIIIYFIKGKKKILKSLIFIVIRLYNSSYLKNRSLSK